MAADSVFTRIIRGELPSAKVYEDAAVFAFLDINPLAEGHTLVVPKRPAERLEDLPAEDAAALARVLGRIGGRVARAVGAPGYNVLLNNGPVAGQLVPHVHFHVIPRREGDGLGYRWDARPAAPAALNALAERIRGALET